MYLLPFFLFVLLSLPFLISSTSVSVHVEVDGDGGSPFDSLSRSISSDASNGEVDEAFEPGVPLPYKPNVRRCGPTNTGYCTFESICNRVGGTRHISTQTGAASTTRSCWGTYKEICCDNTQANPFEGPLEVNPTALSNLLTFLNNNRQIHPELKKVAIVDFTLYSRERRFFYWDFEAPAAGQTVTADNLKNQQNVPVAHGVGSDPDRDGFATDFSNESGSRKSSLGFYRVAELYTGSFGFSARMDGLSRSNSRVRSRAIIIHPWSGVDYNMPTEGCLGMTEEIAIQVEKEMSYKGIVYAYAGQAERDPNDSLIVSLRSLRNLNGAAVKPKPKPKATPKRK